MKKVEELTADLQRVRADFENFRKQTEVQKQQYGGVVKITTVSKVLPLLDDIERAIVTHKELLPLEKGLKKTMAELGLEKIDSEQGVTFDHNLHEAVVVDGEGDAEKISETLRPGYIYEGEVLRPALVKVEKS